MHPITVHGCIAFGLAALLPIAAPSPTPAPPPPASLTEFKLTLSGSYTAPNTISGTWAVLGTLGDGGSYTSTVTGAGTPAPGQTIANVKMNAVLVGQGGTITIQQLLSQTAPAASTHEFTGLTRIVTASGVYTGMRGNGSTTMTVNLAAAPATIAGKVTGNLSAYPPVLKPTRMLRLWSEIANDACGLDHSSAGGHEALGPGRTSRALAIVHVAVFEAVNAVVRRYDSYVGLPVAPIGASRDAAVCKAAHDALVAIYPSQAPSLDAELTHWLAEIPNGTAKTQGIAAGQAAAAAVLALRANDNSALPEPVIGVSYFPGLGPGEWRPDPVSNHPLALGANWPLVTPFMILSASQFRCAPPPSLDSPEYAAAFNEVKSLGGDGVTTPTVRTPDQTTAGIYWGYDGTPGLGPPPVLYNQITAQIAQNRGTDLADTSRLLALATVAMADACIGVWESKYFYKVWRPITGIREADAGTGPSGLGDGNPATAGDPTFSPLGAPATNTNGGVNFTPPFPAYPSGHAGMGAATFQVLRRFYATDNITFTFCSDEFNGVNADNLGVPRPLTPRTFTTLSQGENENAQSRIYLGIHWQFDQQASLILGRDVADWVFDHGFN